MGVLQNEVCDGTLDPITEAFFQPEQDIESSAEPCVGSRRGPRDLCGYMLLHLRRVEECGPIPPCHPIQLLERSGRSQRRLCRFFDGANPRWS